MRGQNITQELLLELIEFDFNSGRMWWKTRSAKHFKEGYRTKEGNAAAWNKKHVGNETFLSVCTGRQFGRIFGENLFKHRVLWLAYYGEWPTASVDHIDRNPLNNSIFNLRDVSHSVNMKNQKLRADNKSGVTGVFWNSHNSKWWAYINRDGQRHTLGYFKDLQDAIDARRRAAEKDDNRNGLQVLERIAA